MNQINKDNVQLAINILVRAQAHDQNLDMEQWQDYRHFRKTPFTREKKVYECGMACCLGGYIAVSPEFQADGGMVGINGYPVFDIYRGAKAVAEWFGIRQPDAKVLTGVIRHNRLSEYRGKALRDITFDDVIAVLERLRDTGSIYPD